MFDLQRQSPIRLLGVSAVMGLLAAALSACGSDEGSGGNDSVAGTEVKLG